MGGVTNSSAVRFCEPLMELGGRVMLTRGRPIVVFSGSVVFVSFAKNAEMGTGDSSTVVDEFGDTTTWDCPMRTPLEHTSTDCTPASLYTVTHDT